MRAYVLGAGASVPIYPLGGRLLEAIDQYIQGCGRCFDRFDYTKDWPELKEWLDKNPNALLHQAYRNGNIEQIFTVLDLAEGLLSDSLSGIFLASKNGAEAVRAAEANYDTLKAEIGEYRHMRTTLLWAMEAFFLHRNANDLKTFRSADADDVRSWKDLRRFGALLEPGDVVVTFNYDSTIERVLLDLGKWAPSDGYGTEIVFQKNAYDEKPATFPASAVKVLHLHGAVGWYQKPVFSPSFNPTAGPGGATPRTSLSKAPLETEIALDPLLLTGLGIHHVDASLPSRPPSERQIMLHPSFLKLYGGVGHSDGIFSMLWKDALHALQRADEVTIIGYSLPSADSAAWTLLHTGCERGKLANPLAAATRGAERRATEAISIAADLPSLVRRIRRRTLALWQPILQDVVKTTKKRLIQQLWMVCRGDNQSAGVVFFK